MKAADVRRTFLEFFKSKGHEVVASSSLVPAQRPDAAVHERRHEPVQGRVHRRRAARLQARDDLAEVRARRRQAQRPRRGRQDAAPPHVLRDARQLLVRRLLQGGRDRVRVGAADEGLRHRSERSSSSPCSAAIRRCPASPPTTRRARSGSASPASATTASSASARRTTSGRWATPARWGRAPRSTSTSDGEAGDVADARIRRRWKGWLEIWNLVFMQFERRDRGRRAVQAAGAVGRYRRGPRARDVASCRACASNYDTDLFTPHPRDGGGARGQDVRRRTPRSTRRCA